MGKPVHSTHQFGLKRGLLWCWRCGKYAATRVKGLTQPCSGKATESSALALTRLKAGTVPRANMAWPLPEPEEEHPGPAGRIVEPPAENAFPDAPDGVPASELEQGSPRDSIQDAEEIPRLATGADSDSD